MGAQGQAHTLESDAKDTLNTRVVPIILVPGVMGTRLDISGFASDWDPDDVSEMASWVVLTRRRNVNALDFRAPATPMREFEKDSLKKKVPVDPISDIFARSRLTQIPIDSRPDHDKINSRAIRSLVIAFWERRGWAEVVWSAYGQFLMQLEEQLNPGAHGGEQRPVYACGYDWRQSNTTSARLLQARIAQALADHPSAKKVVLVTHSMGGLVTRSALTQGAEAKILGVVHTVMPTDGAVVAFRRFFTGARQELLDGIPEFCTILGPTRLEYAVTQSVLRGPTELLPANSYPEIFLRFGQGITNKFFTDVYAEYARQEAPGFMYKSGDKETSNTPDLVVDAADVQNLRSRLREAAAFTRTIENRFHPNTFLMVGDQQRTDVEFDFTKGALTNNGANMEKMVIKSSAGDATVPVASARADACTPIARDSFAVTHGECFTVGSFRAAVIDRVRRLLTL